MSVRALIKISKCILKPDSFHVLTWPAKYVLSCKDCALSKIEPGSATETVHGRPEKQRVMVNSNFITFFQQMLLQ